jgi:lipopolysaccharide/colanic/teichoic acid biosynthesis glycosyltransferase
MKTQVLQTSKHTARTYKHFQISSGEDRIVREPVTNEFFYVGSDKSKINFLLASFGTGYAPENVSRAVSLLERLPSLNSKPALIVIDASLGEQSIKQIYTCLASHIYYQTVPLVLEASELDEAEVSSYRESGLLDEIIFIKREDALNFQQKINFLCRIKKSAGAASVRPELLTSRQRKWVPRAVTKRAFDIVFSLVAIAILLPVLLLVAILIKLGSRGPVLYISKRAGRGYKVFNFFKFRTMILHADQNLEELTHLNRYKSKIEGRTIFFKGDNDPRVTRLGMFLRRTSLDELPQLFNVLIGDMSVVGNRPLPLTEAASLTTDEWAARFLAPAGMTGLWQIRRKYQHEMTVEQRINLDIAYAHKYNFLYDLWIIAKTPSALIQSSNS